MFNYQTNKPKYKVCYLLINLSFATVDMFNSKKKKKNVLDSYTGQAVGIRQFQPNLDQSCKRVTYCRADDNSFGKYRGKSPLSKPESQGTTCFPSSEGITRLLPNTNYIDV